MLFQRRGALAGNHSKKVAKSRRCLARARFPVEAAAVLLSLALPVGLRALPDGGGNDVAAAPDAGVITPGTPPPDVRQSAREAWLNRKLGVPDAARAVERIQAVTRAFPRDAAAWGWLAQAHYWHGLQQADSQVPPDAQVATYRLGINAGKTAQNIDPRQPAGWFWEAVNISKIAEVRGIARSADQLPRLLTCMDKVDELAPGYFHGGTGRFWAAVIYSSPSLLRRVQGYDLDDAEKFLRDSQKVAPYFVGTLRFYAELRMEQDRRADAVALLRQAALVPVHPDQDVQAWNTHEKMLSARMLMRLERR